MKSHRQKLSLLLCTALAVHPFCYAQQADGGADEGAGDDIPVGVEIAEPPPVVIDDAVPTDTTVDEFQPFSAFTVEDIRIEGLQRFSPGIIFTRVPVDIGDELSAETAVDIIKVLYETGYFRGVNILRDGNILVVQVDENPTIAEVTVSGADDLSDDALDAMLNGAGIAQSRVFNRSVIEQAARAIEDAYVERNFYEVSVESVISPLPRNRVAVLFNVDEGAKAAINSINIIGNSAFSTWRLRRAMVLEEKGIINFFTDNYHFSQSKLDSDLGRIRTRYLEAGYLRYEAEAVQVEVSTDKRDIDIIIRINEGKLYRVASAAFKLSPDSPEVQFDVEDFNQYIGLSEGAVYSGQVSNEAIERARNILGDLGYANADIQFSPDINDEDGTVDVVYLVHPNRRLNVREINIVGNELTQDEVIRREMLQFERERYSRDKIERSRSRLRRLGYFSSVEISTQPVPDSPDQVDLLVKVQESKTGEFTVGTGFSSSGGLSFQAGLTQTNIFGSGNDFSANFEKGEDNLLFNLGIDEHYHTKDGVTRHVGISYSENSADDDEEDYSIDGYSVEYGYSLPFTDDGSVRAYLEYEQVNIDNAGNLNAEYQPFVDKHGVRFDSLLLDTGLLYDTRDSSTVPTEGQRVDVRGELALPVLDLQYFYLSYLHNYYQSLRQVPLSPVMRARLGYGYGNGYGDGEYPFYRRFTLGGTSNIRGFGGNSIGFNSGGDAIGGLSRIYGSLEFSADTDLFESQQVFFVPFVDVGAVGRKFGLGSFRGSGGVEIRWLSPIGPLRFSYVVPFLQNDGDDIEKFQFAVSTF